VLLIILSRCQRFDFRRIPLEALEKHLAWIAAEEAIAISPEALRLVAQRAQGGLRDAESLLDQLSLLPPPVEPEAVWELLGAIPEQELLQLAQAMAAGEPLGVVETSRELMDRGREAGAVLQGLASLLRDLLLAGVAPDRLELTSVSPGLRPELPGVARSIGKARLLHWQAQLKGSEQQLRHSVQPRLWLEVLLLGLLAEAVPGDAVQPVAGTHGVSGGAVPRTAATASPPPPPAAAPGPAAMRPHGGSSGIEAAPPQPSAAPTMGEAAAPPSSAPPAPQPAANTNLPELWQQILAGLELASTRMLLTQQAHLHRLDSQRAVVRVSGNWMAMVQSRLPLLEKAMTRALGSPRTITLEASDQRQQQPPPAATAAAAAAAVSVTTPPPADSVGGGAVSAEANRVSEPAGSAAGARPAARPNPGVADPTAVPVAPAAESPAAAAPPFSEAAAAAAATQVSGAAAGGTANQADASPPPARASRIEEKAKLFADFFNGEVIADDTI
jgi:DNA polymerase-3 subunit gamma/tau